MACTDPDQIKKRSHAFKAWNEIWHFMLSNALPMCFLLVRDKMAVLRSGPVMRVHILSGKRELGGR